MAFQSSLPSSTIEQILTRLATGKGSNESTDRFDAGLKTINF